MTERLRALVERLTRTAALLLAVAALGLPLSGAVTTQVQAQDDDEWYDPGDWFDDDYDQDDGWFNGDDDWDNDDDWFSDDDDWASDDWGDDDWGDDDWDWGLETEGTVDWNDSFWYEQGDYYDYDDWGYDYETDDDWF